MMFLARLKMATTGVNRSQHIFDSEADQEENQQADSWVIALRMKWTCRASFEWKATSSFSFGLMLY
uniref:Uncharacterized protein n=1 Tax=Anguilla anguilla TaxID=7936 RepID=A0A0E9VPV4_ANGAN